MIHTGLTATYPRLQQPTGDSFSHPCPVCGELPLGKKGMSVLNEPQLSAQPCRHSTGWPCSGPQALPLISPHGTGIESSETRDNTAQLQSVGSTNTTICQTFDDQSKDFTTAMRAESGKKKNKQTTIWSRFLCRYTTFLFHWWHFSVQFLSQGNKRAKFSKVNKSHKLFQFFFKAGSSWPLASDFIGCSEWHAAAMANPTPQGCVSPLHTPGKSMLLLFQSVRPAGVPEDSVTYQPRALSVCSTVRSDKVKPSEV